ncbi:MAG: sigma-54-dependent Fis family transcriptional regulator [Nevskia sp.]|nr:sigma-54-dependent Fis family transcriptional regulator [Nevskia sp.]
MLRPSALVEHSTQAFTLVHHGGNAPIARRLDRLVASSWARCVKEYGIEPRARSEHVVLDTGSLKERQQRLGEMLRVAHAEMENLYEQIAGSGYAVILTDGEGTILSAITDPLLKREFRRAGLWLGAVWDERHEGTNGIGTCIAERRPVTVHRDEHFMSYNIGLSCSGAPITDSQGRLLAVLDASSVNSSDTRAVQRHTMALVNTSASLISRYQFLNEQVDRWVLRFHSRAEFLGLPQEALIALDERGLVRAVNAAALEQLGFDDRAELVGRPFDGVFQIEFGEIERRAASQPGAVWPLRECRHGRRFFVTVSAPRLRSAAPAGLVLPGRSRTVATFVPAPAAAPPAQPSAAADWRRLGSDPRVCESLRRAAQLFVRGVPILLHGATGTGKEVFARTLHALSPRAERPFVAINCASIPEALIEAELFGYARGAFTDAAKEGRRGKIQLADGGTLFLDEIGDMPLALQARLLRVLEEREVLPLGSERPLAVDIHVISASHRDLAQMVQQGAFREDLYYRLNGMRFTLPLLRERSDREELLARILAECAAGGAPPRIAAPARSALLAYSWPGNIRQMRHVLQALAALHEGGEIGLADLPPEIAAAASAGETPAPAAPPDDSSPLQAAERRALLGELQKQRWNMSRTARALGLSRTTLYRKLKKHRLPLAHDGSQLPR